MAPTREMAQSWSLDGEVEGCRHRSLSWLIRLLPPWLSQASWDPADCSLESVIRVKDVGQGLCEFGGVGRLVQFVVPGRDIRTVGGGRSCKS